MNRQYIGARYVPKFYENPQGNNEWVAGVAYEALTIVTYLNNSYTSKKPVPARNVTPNLDTEYWVLTGAYNAQVELYRQEVVQLKNEWSQFELDINTDIDNFKRSFGFVTPQDYGGVGDGITDDTTAITRMFQSGNVKFLFPTGTYVTSGRMQPPNNCLILGYGATILHSLTTSSCFEIVNSNIKIKGLIFTRNTGIGRNEKNTSLMLIHNVVENTTQRNIIISECIFENADMYAINIESSNPCYDITIEKCAIHDVWIGVKNGGGLTRDIGINNCYIYNTMDECVTFDGTVRQSYITNSYLLSNRGGVGLIGCDNSSNIRITNNHFSGINNSGELYNGITFNRHLGTCTYYTISNNTMFNINRGIWCREQTEEYPHPPVTHLTCQGNTFQNVREPVVIEEIGGRNIFLNTYSTSEPTRVYTLSNDNSKLAKILQTTKFDLPQEYILTQDIMSDGFTLSTVTGKHRVLKTFYWTISIQAELTTNISGTTNFFTLPIGLIGTHYEPQIIFNSNGESGLLIYSQSLGVFQISLLDGRTWDSGSTVTAIFTIF